MPGAILTFSSLLCFVLLAMEPASAVQLTFQVARPRINTDNLRYSTNITIAGNVVNILINTGSTDLWVIPPQDLTNFNDTGLSRTLHYGTGANYVTDDIGIRAFQLDGGEFAVCSRHPRARLRHPRRLPLGATSTAAQPVLSNISAQNPDQSDYTGIALNRNGGQEGTADGSLTTAEYDRYAFPPPPFPSPSSRYISFRAHSPPTSISHHILLLTHSNSGIHPLDVTDMQILTSPDGRHNFTVCVNAFTDIGTIAGFLRNVDIAFDFGTGGRTKGTPFVQMLSNTDVTKSAADYLAVRAAAMAGMPPE
ncbi:hypothetical protein K438DRAFT_1984056 [Mycena galopus ATCC 62051]|nr:hypothetical protein K438DRAFT_1984056 [Mycena galopus ATCC 62051]